jgi:hypothetical protein
MPEAHACCDDIIAAKADIRAIEQGNAQSRIDAQKWRDDHEARNNETFQRFGGEIADNRRAIDALRNEMVRRFDAMDTSLDLRLKGIEDKLANRLPGWATLGFTVAGLTIGTLVGVILDLGGKLLHIG